MLILSAIGLCFGLTLAVLGTGAAIGSWQRSRCYRRR
jgi:hypothetical protein